MDKRTEILAEFAKVNNWKTSDWLPATLVAIDYTDPEMGGECQMRFFRLATADQNGRYLLTQDEYKRALIAINQKRG